MNVSLEQMYIKLGITSQINSPVWNIYLGTRRSEKNQFMTGVLCIMPNSKLAGDVSYQTPLAFVNEVQVILKYTLAQVDLKPRQSALQGMQVRGFPLHSQRRDC